jgi:hypothetical protein
MRGKEGKLHVKGIPFVVVLNYIIRLSSKISRRKHPLSLVRLLKSIRSNVLYPVVPVASIVTLVVIDMACTEVASVVPVETALDGGESLAEIPTMPFSNEVVVVSEISELLREKDF